MHHAKVTFSWKSVHRRICDYVLKLLKWSSAAAKRTDKTCKVNRPNLISWEMHGCMDGVKHRGRIGCQETQSACVTTRKLRVWKHIDNESRGTNKLTNKKSTLKTKKSTEYQMLYYLKPRLQGVLHDKWKSKAEPILVIPHPRTRKLQNISKLHANYRWYQH